MPSKRKIVLSSVMVAAVALAIFGLYELRAEADGWHNAFNLHYWQDRVAGRDLYNPESHYVKRGPRGSNEILLTFDDGPHIKSVWRILDTLKEKKCPATFFVVGKRVKETPAAVKRMIDDGQEVGNHTQDHLRLDTLDKKHMDNEIVNCEVNVERACGRGTRLLRPPGMRLSDDVTKETMRMGYYLIGWNVGAKDFIPDQKVTDMTAEESKSMKTTSAEVAERVLDNVHRGTIILLHDNPVTADALPQIIDGCRSKGLIFVSTKTFMAHMQIPLTVEPNPVRTPPPLPKPPATPLAAQPKAPAPAKL